MATIYYTASSLDGYIATTEHSLDWLTSRDIDPAGPHSYAEFVAGVGALVMGANTYQWLLDNDPGGVWPYSCPAWVVTHRTFPARDADIRFTGAPIAEVHAAGVRAAAGRDVWLVGGGELVAQFHDAGLLDEVHVQLTPATLGSGQPLLPRRIDLDLVDVARNRDFVCTRYRVRR